MSEKSIKIQKRVVQKEKQKIANQLVYELLNAPFRYRFKFAIRLLLGK